MTDISWCLGCKTMRLWLYKYISRSSYICFARQKGISSTQNLQIQFWPYIFHYGYREAATMIRNNTFKDQFISSCLATHKKFLQFSAASVFIFFGLSLIALISGGLLPPPAPTWDAERVADFYHDHEHRINACVSLLMLSCPFYMMFTVALSSQMRRIPDAHYNVCALQLIAGAAGTLLFPLMAIVLATANFRHDRIAEIT